MTTVHCGNVKAVTDGVSASVFYVKKKQLETSTMIEDEAEALKMKGKQDGVNGGKRGKTSSKKNQQAGDKDKLPLPLPPRSE